MTQLRSELHNALLLAPAEVPAHIISQAQDFVRHLGTKLSVQLLAPVPDPARYPKTSGKGAAEILSDGTAFPAAALAALQEESGAALPVGAIVAHYPELINRSARAAALADLALLPEPRLWPAASLLEAALGACLDETCCPVVILRGKGGVPAKRVLIAWDGSRPCSRAWRDARPLLTRDARVEIAFGGRVDRDDAATFAANLTPPLCPTLHEVAIHAVPFERRSATERLVELEGTLKPDLTIMGAGTGKTLSGMLDMGLAPLLISR